MIGALTFVLLGSCSARGRHQELQIEALGHATDMTAVCTRALTLLDKGDTASAHAVLRTSLIASVQQAGELARELAPSSTFSGRPTPNMAGVMRSASEYLAANDPQAAQTAAKVAHTLSTD